MSDKEVTHTGSFYGVPIVLDMSDPETPTIAGKNAFCDYLFCAATWFHNEIIERGAQLCAAISGQGYEPGFPLYIREKE